MTRIFVLTLFSFVHGQNLNNPFHPAAPPVPPGSYPVPPGPNPLQPPSPFQPHPPWCKTVYNLHPSPLSWHAAQKVCEDIDPPWTNLATVNSLTEQHRLGTFRHIKGLWLGATNAWTGDGQWKWVTNKDLGFTNFFPGQPDRQTYDPACLQLNPDLAGGELMWDDADCNSPKPYLCEILTCELPGFLRESNSTASSTVNETVQKIPAPVDTTAKVDRRPSVPRLSDPGAFKAKLFNFLAMMSKSDEGCRELPNLDGNSKWVCNSGRHRWICILKCLVGIPRGKGVIICMNGSWKPSGDNSCH